MKNTTIFLGSIGLALVIASTACGPLEPPQEIDEQSFALEAEEENPWQTHQYLSVFGWGSSDLSFISLTVEDWGQSSDSEDSSYLHARVRNAMLQTLYNCSITDPKAALVSRLPDGGGFIGPNKPLVYTLEAPACDAYPGGTFTVSCGADTSCHTKSSDQMKGTLPDGTHTFLSVDRESLKGPSCIGSLMDCTVTFDNHIDGAVTWTGSYWSGLLFVNATEERRRVD